MRILLAAPALLALAACATPLKPSGFLSSYEGLTPHEDAVRAKIAVRKDEAGLAQVRKVRIAPTVLHPVADAEWMNDNERQALAREVDAQLCFELTERYDLAKAGDPPDAEVRAAITRVDATGRVGSAVSAAAGVFIPGPIGLRVPGGLGGLGAEAEMLDPKGRQLAAITWNRSATAVGTDNPSLSRIGDALQFAEQFADEAAKAMTAEETKSRDIPDPDPCAEYGPRFRPEGWLAKFATGLYVPQAAAAKPEEPAQETEK
ncbi:hypothetical protein PHZ_c1694 [Phenylobacterium zucineum HLK1]|uniref:DUF3313 domain-containing protein n=1 Tax=Phenylobacterium zucineum (strain HLK1) TaxID=450851 RepID=B4RBQ8_PHEZH|nr:DUF3313 domain-containing protein [Phenylobacterium zucineum]ACG78105.1 hypothetical protein PHZ_c1694 [Phenylobacterium zucineum HLK1]